MAILTAIAKTTILSHAVSNELNKVTLFHLWCGITITASQYLRSMASKAENE